MNDKKRKREHRSLLLAAIDIGIEGRRVVGRARRPSGTPVRTMLGKRVTNFSPHLQKTEGFCEVREAQEEIRCAMLPAWLSVPLNPPLYHTAALSEGGVQAGEPIGIVIPNNLDLRQAG